MWGSSRQSRRQNHNFHNLFDSHVAGHLHGLRQHAAAKIAGRRIVRRMGHCGQDICPSHRTTTHIIVRIPFWSLRPGARAPGFGRKVGARAPGSGRNVERAPRTLGERGERALRALGEKWSARPGLSGCTKFVGKLEYSRSVREPTHSCRRFLHRMSIGRGIHGTVRLGQPWGRPSDCTDPVASARTLSLAGVQPYGTIGVMRSTPPGHRPSWPLAHGRPQKKGCGTSARQNVPARTEALAGSWHT